MNSRVHISLVAALSCLALSPGLAAAADARVGVHPSHGEMVLLRNVNARPAYRPAPPSVALIADPRPNREINAALGTGELSDADFASLSSGQALGPIRPAPAIGATVNNALAGSLGTGSGQNRAAVPGGNVGGALSGPLGTVGATTRGISGHVTGALSQFPFGQTPATTPTGPGGP